MIKAWKKKFLKKVIYKEVCKERISPENLSTGLGAIVSNIEKLSPGFLEPILHQLYAGMKPDNQEENLYKIAENLSTTVYPKYKFSEYGRIFLEDESFMDYYAKFMDPGNWHSLDRKYTLNQLLKLTEHLQGDIVECGVYKGASAYLMCESSLKTDKTIHLFDSFEGLSNPGDFDGTYWQKGGLKMPENELFTSLSSYNNFKVYKGWIPDRFSDVSDINVSFLHIDVDLYQPTLDTLAFFYERMVPNGIILMDDYGFRSCPGAKKAADDFFAEREENIVMMTTGQGMVIKI